MKEIFKFVIIGSGNIAQTYHAVIQQLEKVSLAGMISRTASRPSWLEKETCEVKESLGALTQNFDAVILATPNGLHHKGAVEAAKMGKHVLTEKPLDVTLQAMDTMIETCRRHDVKLGVTYQRRTSPDNIVMHDLIKNNQLGTIFSADVTVKNYRDQSYYESVPYRGTWKIDGGGPFMMQAIHNIDLYGWFFGAPTRIVSSYDTFTHNIEVEDHGAAILNHDEGMIGTIISSTSAKPGFNGKIEIHAEKGTVVMENDIITSWKVEGMKNPSKATDTNIHSGATSASVSDISGHKAIVEDFVASVKEDRKPLVDGASAWLATEIVLQIYDHNLR